MKNEREFIYWAQKMLYRIRKNEKWTEEIAI